MTGVPLDDHAAMYVSAGRRRQTPCVGVLRRFEQRIAPEALAAYAEQLGANPRGFGRRVVAPRLPGARPRWEAATVLPALRVEADPLTAADVAQLLDDEVSMPPDPWCDPGWRLTAVSDSEGGTIVLTWLHHAYGDGRAILEAAFAPFTASDDPPAAASARPVRELEEVMGRVGRGVRGGVRLGREAATAGWRDRDSDLARLRPALGALRARDRSVGGRSQRRMLAMARVAADDWDGVAAARGGSGNALLIAVLANLLREARLARGEVLDRPLRVMLPFDTRSTSGTAGVAAAQAPGNTAAAAVLTMPAGRPDHGSLVGVRAATREALREA